MGIGLIIIGGIRFLFGLCNNDDGFGRGGMGALKYVRERFFDRPRPGDGDLLWRCFAVDSEFLISPLEGRSVVDVFSVGKMFGPAEDAKDDALFCSVINCLVVGDNLSSHSLKAAGFLELQACNSSVKDSGAVIELVLLPSLASSINVC